MGYLRQVRLYYGLPTTSHNFDSHNSRVRIFRSPLKQPWWGLGEGFAPEVVEKGPRWYLYPSVFKSWSRDRRSFHLVLVQVRRGEWLGRLSSVSNTLRGQHQLRFYQPGICPLIVAFHQPSSGLPLVCTAPLINLHSLLLMSPLRSFRTCVEHGTFSASDDSVSEVQ